MMKTNMRLTTILLFGFMFYTPIVSFSAVQPPFDQSELAHQLTLWQENKKKLNDLRQQLETIDVLSDPDHDERFWWNPLWRSTRESDLQKANRLTLTIQEMDGKQQTIAPQLNNKCNQYISWTLQQKESDKLIDHRFRQQVDNWRFNYLINRIDIQETRKRLNKLDNRELLKTTLLHLETIQSSWKQLLNYFILTNVSSIPTTQNSYNDWNKRFTNKSEQLSRLIEQVYEKLTAMQ